MIWPSSSLLQHLVSSCALPAGTELQILAKSATSEPERNEVKFMVRFLEPMFPDLSPWLFLWHHSAGKIHGNASDCVMVDFYIFCLLVLPHPVLTK